MKAGVMAGVIAADVVPEGDTCKAVLKVYGFGRIGQKTL